MTIHEEYQSYSPPTRCLLAAVTFIVAFGWLAVWLGIVMNWTR